jgi:hypothetical protein
MSLITSGLFIVGLLVNTTAIAGAYQLHRRQRLFLEEALTASLFVNLGLILWLIARVV